MKKMLMISLSAASSLMLAGCGKPNDMVQESKNVQTKGTHKVARQKTSSGLEYEVIQEGTGASPQKGKPVTVHYTGWLNDNGQPGKKFDSSVDRGRPFTFTIGVGQVIKGWDEGVLSMKVGEKRRLFIPAQLGYGPNAVGNLIPANSDLIFDVELLQV